MKLLLIILLALTGCATYRERMKTLTPADVTALAKAGTPDEEIIRRIDDTRSIYRLGAADVVQLRQDGVSERVVNHMLDTYVRYSLTEQRRRDFYDWGWHYRGYWYAPHHCR